jgi:lauroyl/myristoyl acyltransferase
MLNEKFSVGFVVYNFNMGGYSPDNYNLYYLDEKKCDKTLDIAFYTTEDQTKNKLAYITVKNNCSFPIVFIISAIKGKKVHLISTKNEVDPDKTLSIEVDPNVTCYRLTGIKDKPE